MNLITDSHFDAPDDFYESLIDAHRDLPTALSHELNAKLVLLLANHIGDAAALAQALALARSSVLASHAPIAGASASQATSAAKA